MLLFGWELPRQHDLGQKALQMETVTLLYPFKLNRSSPWKVQVMHFFTAPTVHLAGMPFSRLLADLSSWREKT